jgi:hypothetical protein
MNRTFKILGMQLVEAKTLLLLSYQLFRLHPTGQGKPNPEIFTPGPDEI